MNQINVQALAGQQSKERLLLDSDYEQLRANNLAVTILNAMPIASMVLNKQRQLIFGNTAFLTLLQIDSIEPFIGIKPGDLLGCNNVKSGFNGCGTSDACRVCGVFKTLSDCISDGSGLAECTINSSLGAQNLAVKAETITIDQKEFILFSFLDISNEKKRILLERIFYHDILNTAHNISGMTELLASGEYEDSREQFLGMLMKSASKLIDEINTHRLITFDTQLEQSSKPVIINSRSFFNDLQTEFRSYMTGNESFMFDSRSEDFSFYGNEVLIKRVVTNMIKNAFEAEQDEVRITFGMIPFQQNGAMIWVNNPGYMTEEVQLQIFNRSFSTKASDRGLGTYSMKLLTEKYLNGKIYFTSKKETGTSFIIEIPGQS